MSFAMAVATEPRWRPLRALALVVLGAGALVVGLPLVYWGIVGAVVLFDMSPVLLPLAIVVGLFSALPVASALVAGAAVLTDDPRSTRIALIMTATVAMAVAGVFATAWLFG